MKFWTLILIAFYQLLDPAIAEWDTNSPLVLVGQTRQAKYFPTVVRTSERYQCTVYFTGGMFGNEEQLITYAYCPERGDIDEFCNYSQSFIARRYDWGDRPRSRCDAPVKFFMIRKYDDNGNLETCTHYDDIGYFYKIVYWLCKEEGDKEAIIVYQACYHGTKKQIMVGKYIIIEPSLLTNSLLADEQNYPFAFDAYDYFSEFLNHFYLITHPLYEQNNLYVRRPVLPPEWLPFGYQRNALYHYMNVAPMDRDLIAGWEKLMDNMRYKLSRMSGSIKITAGLLDVLLNEDDTIKYLGTIDGTEEIPIPSVWWVLIQNRRRTQGVVLMMHNEPYYINFGRPNLHHYDNEQCGAAICKKSNIKNALPDANVYPFNFFYCCRPHVITGRFGLKGSNNRLVFPN